jgi:nucleotide-binding universal stress UspA family protein
MIHISHVLCPVDFSECSRHALVRAAAIAGWYDADLTLLYVFVNRPAMDLPPLRLEAADRQRLLGDLGEFAASTIPGRRVSLQVEEAEFADRGILDHVAAQDTDLLVLGTHGRSGFRHLLLGSVTEKVIRRAPCPTLVVPPIASAAPLDAPPAFRHILCPVDFSTSSLAGADYALALAQEADANLRLLHVVEIPPVLARTPDEVDLARLGELATYDARQRLADLVPRYASDYCAIETAVVEGRAYREILRTAARDRDDLIVMGVQGRGAVDLLLFGSTTHHVVRLAPCPVLVVRSGNGVAAALAEWRESRRRRRDAVTRATSDSAALEARP